METFHLYVFIQRYSFYVDHEYSFNRFPYSHYRRVHFSVLSLYSLYLQVIIDRICLFSRVGQTKGILFSSLCFGFIHIIGLFNGEAFSTICMRILLSTIAGIAFGYVSVFHSPLFSILLHACNNFLSLMLSSVDERVVELVFLLFYLSLSYEITHKQRAKTESHVYSTNIQNASYVCLRQNLVGEDVHGLDGLGGDHGVASTRLGRNSLEEDLLTLVLALQSLVALHTVEVLQSALGRLDVLHTNVNSLLDDAVSHLLVHLHTHRGLGDVEHNSSASVVSLEGHTLVDGSVGLNIDVVSILVAAHVSGERNHSMLAEVSLEHVASTGTISVSVRHDLNKGKSLPLHKSATSCLSVPFAIKQRWTRPDKTRKTYKSLVRANS